jgi:hypothetical protein
MRKKIPMVKAEEEEKDEDLWDSDEFDSAATGWDHGETLGRHDFPLPGGA